MYNAFFGFQKAPFASAPDPEVFFPSNHHDAALRGLQLSVEARMGLISLVGDEGTGKTLVLERLRNSLGAGIPCAFVRDSRISFDQFLETIASDLNLDLLANTKSARQVFLALIRLATQQAQSGRTVLLIVDEAHNLPADVFTEIIHTASVQHGKVKAIQTVFAGRPELQSRLAALNPDRIKQRAILSRSLHPFTPRETQEYVQFRLACAGMPKQTVFPRKALEEIYDLSQGYAPAIHALCERLLLEAFSTKSKVCTQAVRDQVFRNPRRNLSPIVQDSPTLVASPRIDPSLLAPRPEPEPPPMQTAFLLVAVYARTGSFRPRLGSMDERPAHLAPIGLTAFPSGRFALAGGELPEGSTQPIPHTRYTKDSVLRSSLGRGTAISSIPVTGVLPRLPEGAAAEPCPLSATQLLPSKFTPRTFTSGRPTASPFAEHSSYTPPPAYPGLGLQPASVIPCPTVPLTPIRTIKNDGRARAAAHPVTFASSLCPMRPTAGLQPASIIPCSRVPLASIRKTKHSGRASAAVPADTFPLTSIQQPMHPTAGLQPASIIPCSRVQLTPIQTIKDDERNSAAAHADSSPLASIPQPMHPTAGLQPASIIPCSRVPLTPIQTIKYDGRARAAAHADHSPLTSAPQPMHPTAGLQPASIILGSHVPFTPSRATRIAPLPPSAKHLVEIANLIPLGRPAATDLGASFYPSSELPNRLLTLAFSTQHVPPPVGAPIGPSLSVQPSLQAHRPYSGLKPADPAKPSLLLPSTWIPLIASAKGAWESPADTFTGAGERLAFLRRPLLTVVIPILAALAFYGTLPAMRAAAEVPRQGWQRAHRAVLNRAAVALDENFRTGLHDWTDRGGSPPSWTSDASGFVHPGALALYRPSLGMVDYQMQFLGTIDKKGLSWVVRAADFNNYYAIRLTVLKPGPLPSIGVTRYAVIHGIPQKRFTTPLLMSAQADTVYRVRLDIQGDRFALFVQDQPVDSWSEPRLEQGGIGFFSEKDAGSRIASVQARGHYDMLGRLCASLLPSSVSSDR